MKRFDYFLFIVITTTYITSAFGQSSDSTLLKQRLLKSNVEVPYKYLLDKEFTKVLLDQNTNFGSFASLETKDDIASLSGHISFKQNSNLGINLKGGVTEGIVALLNGQEVNPNISLGLQFNLGIYKDTQSIRADATQIFNFLYALDSLRKATRNIIYTIDNSRDKKEFEIKQKDLQLKQKDRNLQTLLAYKPKSSNIKYLQKNIETDSIQVLILNTKYEIAQLKNDIANLNNELTNLTDDMLAREKQNIQASNVKKHKLELQKLSLISYKLNWFSFSARLNNRTFETLDSSLVYNNQISKTNNTNCEIGINYNVYQLKDEPFQSYFFSIGIAYLLEDNFEDLIKTTLNEKQDISLPPQSRTIEKTKTVYIGEYRSGISKMKLDFNSYWFLTYNQSIALHINPTARADFKENIKIDCVVGLLVGFREKDKDNSIINTELFFKIADMFKKVEDEGDKFIDKGSIGIKLSVPINFNQKL